MRISVVCCDAPTLPRSADRDHCRGVEQASVTSRQVIKLRQVPRQDHLPLQ
jgi:hypothetical protein